MKRLAFYIMVPQWATDSKIISLAGLFNSKFSCWVNSGMFTVRTKLSVAVKDACLFINYAIADVMNLFNFRVEYLTVTNKLIRFILK